MKSQDDHLLVEIDRYGEIKNIILNSFEEVEVQNKSSILHLFHEKEHQRIENHIYEVAQKSPMMGNIYELITGDKCFLIMIKNGSIRALCLHSNIEVVEFLGHVADTCNYQTKYVVDLYKKLVNEDTETGFLEDIMSLNNELINTRRELATKNNELQKLNDDLQKINFTDFLTGAHNRRKFFVDVYDKLIKNDLYLIMMDFNNFKVVNDKYGHDKGDEMLLFFTNFVRKQILDTRGELYRLGGDEFAILIPTDCTFNVNQTFEKIDKELTRFDNQVSMAYGMVEVNQTTNIKKVVIEDYMRKADALMYNMKIEFYNKKGISKPRINKRK